MVYSREKVKIRPQQENTMNAQHVNLLTFRKRITKLIKSASVMRCKEHVALNYSESGAIIRGIFDQLRKIKEDCQHTKS